MIPWLIAGAAVTVYLLREQNAFAALIWRRFAGAPRQEPDTSQAAALRRASSGTAIDTGTAPPQASPGMYAPDLLSFLRESPHVVDMNGGITLVDLAEVARNLVGKPLREAESALWSIQGASYRISGPNTMQTADYDRNRVGLFVENGIVTGAGVG